MEMQVSLYLKVYNVMYNESLTLPMLLELIRKDDSSLICHAAFLDLIHLIFLFSYIVKQYNDLESLYNISGMTMDVFVYDITAEDDDFNGIVVSTGIYTYMFFDPFYLNEFVFKEFLSIYYSIEIKNKTFLWEKIPYKFTNI